MHELKLLLPVPLYVYWLFLLFVLIVILYLQSPTFILFMQFGIY